MPSQAYEDIMLLIADAEKHFHTVDRLLGEYFGSNPVAMDNHDDSAAGTRTWIVTKVEPLPAEMRLAAKHCLTSAREALDHVASRLVAKSLGSQRPKWRVYFPIADTAEKYPALRKKYLQDLPQDVLDLIDNAQPYKGGNGHALWQLNKLVNSTKHDQLLSVNSNAGGVSVSESVTERFRSLGFNNIDLPDVFIRPEGGRIPLIVGNAVMVEGIEPGIPKLRVQLLVLFNAFDVAADRAAHFVLADILNAVIPLVKSLEPYL